MTFFAFADKHLFVTTTIVFTALLVLDNAVGNICRVILAKIQK